MRRDVCRRGLTLDVAGWTFLENKKEKWDQAGGEKRGSHPWQLCFASSRWLFRIVSHVASKPINMKTLSSVDGMMGMHAPGPMGLKIRGKSTPVKMNLKRRPNTGHRECR